MTYRIEFSEKSKKQIKKLSKETKIKIITYLEARVSKSPLSQGKRLKGFLGEYWRYRVGDYRVICSVESAKLMVMVIEVGHRSKIYK